MAVLALQDVSRKITTVDILICAFVFLLSVIAIFALFMPKSEGKTVIIEVDGEKYGTYNINIEKKVIEIKSKYGYNIVSIGDGYAQVMYADCPDKLDVKRGKISKAGESIVCLPNRLRIYIQGQSKTDTISY